MKQVLFIVAVFFLIGCDKRNRLLLGNFTEATITFAGQSNALGGNGLSEGFSNTLSQASRQMLPIDCAAGGTSIVEWQKGKTLYNECLAQMKIHRPSVIVWWQGEADVHTSERMTWDTKFKQMVGDFRADLGYTVPVIFVQLGAGRGVEMSGADWIQFRQIQASVSMAGVTMVDVSKFDSYHKINGDGNVDVHYTREGYQAIGEYLANVYLG